MNLEALKDRLQTFFDNKHIVLQRQIGYCTTCYDVEDVEVITDSNFQFMLLEIDKWAAETFKQQGETN